MRKIYKPICTFMFLLTILLLTACSNTKSSDIVTTLFPQYDITKQIVGDKLSVRLMTPFGSEVHSYEPTAKDIINVKESKLFIYTSDDMERWAKNVIDENTNALNLSLSYTSIPHQNSNTVSDDLHYWTDPTTILQLINVIRDEIIKVDPKNTSYYQTNAQIYYDDLNKIHNDLANFLKDKNTPSVFFYGHNAMGSFGNRYGINIVSLSSSYQPDALPTPGQLTTLKQKIKDNSAKYLFVEELIDLKAPNSLKTELEKEGYSITLLELHGFHNISNDQNKKGVSYVDLLKQNLENLRKALS